MSSYDGRNAAQIRLDEMIVKYQIRAREAEKLAERYRQDEEFSKQLNLLLADLQDLKTKVDKLSLKGGKIGSKN